MERIYSAVNNVTDLEFGNHTLVTEGYYGKLRGQLQCVGLRMVTMYGTEDGYNVWD